MDDFKDFSDAVNWIEGIAPFGINLGLDRMRKLLEMLGNPELCLQYIHVAGTNGKGSTCAFLTEVLFQSGYSVATFTSPCIERFTNRIRYDGIDIPEQEVLAITNILKPIVDTVSQSNLGHPTAFEVTTCMALVYFSQIKPDFVVLEVGLGGRLDSTNLISPLVSIITNIGHDHMAILGDSLEKIAHEKAGIIKHGVPVISAVEQEEVIEVIQQHFVKNSSQLFLLKRDFDFEIISSKLNDQVFNFKSKLGNHEHLSLKINGQHQFKNASVAIMALEILRKDNKVQLNGLRKGLEHTEWAGRLEMISDEPRILLDGAHNPVGAKTLADALTKIYTYKKLNLLVGMLNTKEHSEYFKSLLPLVDTLIITEPAFRNQMPAAELYLLAQQIVRENDLKARVHLKPDWKEALQFLSEMTKKDELAVVSGTLYLISDVRSWILYKSDSYKGL
ncbi:dihydrofolate synthase / folylpolyglutamate synthase [Paenibacillus sp. 1_12]|uniref:bifunctional folylpolyglutamate synthase/dihydrofolate synthase n=1 Tax=Paenibacillus sp. 1_12 TaxID=1566278 RepID=UPI0008F1CA94|nr:folylpolyglutamate synthase/dihydrofolate synthase family protein [Paenibacillus sp. 1_12]SFM26816.1 dihydrofolate synthase / folylpolyglutamate synthase [Paenibacillus sp. 1_12]